MNILIHTWWFSRYKGSEFSVAYNFVTEMARYHHLYVIVESCSYKFADYSEFSDYSIENCDFIFVKPNLWTRFLDLFHKYGKSKLAAWSSYLAFNSWEHQIYHYIKKCHFLNDIDIIHFLGPVGYHEPGYLYKIKRPYIWGPVAGFENVDTVLLNRYLSGRLLIKIKSIINTIVLHTNRRLKTIMDVSNVVIAATNSNRVIIEKLFKSKKVLYFPENLMRITESELLQESFLEKKYSKFYNGLSSDLAGGAKLLLIWCGSLIARKMPNLLIDSIKKCACQDKIQVLVIGDGPLRGVIDTMIQNEKITCIQLLGNIERKDVERYFNQAHLHILTSAYESNTTVMFEAMENAVPSIVLNHCGMADLTIHQYNGIKIDITDYEMICSSIAQAIDNLVINPELLLAYALNLREFSKNYVIERRAKFYNDIYQQVNKKKEIL
jgi:glycosyltransferase involved in cell wall biosynthesis